MPIKMPERFRQQLSHQAAAVIENMLVYLDSSPYYFEEYTIHGRRHVEQVLLYADQLIPEQTYDTLCQPQDDGTPGVSVDVLVLGICLHDLGMFIKDSGLERLLACDKPIKDNAGREVTWRQLWEEHTFRVKHASGEELEDIFGSHDVAYDRTSHPFCASFIRRYHHLIADHIATVGFSGVTETEILSGIDPQQRKLIGLLAASHGMEMRNPSLKTGVDSFGYDDDLPLNVPVYYLMAVLRLADLLDADGNRAPKLLSDMNEFTNKISEREWVLNQLITGRQWLKKRPETLKLIARPTDSVQYHELKAWFDYWQQELDLSWAVIGEKYQDDYRLSVRRITSNILEESFAKTCDFVTKPVSLKVNPDIVKLLVAPLYGDDPSYGVRELVQNAVDACNERTALDGTPGEITVEVDTERRTFTITDNGIGMNEDVIAHYFLTAGASYRYSQAWAEQFTDDENHPTVVRSGRFGVGALATFLLGETATVTTRHIGDEKGYHFTYTVKPGLLNVTRVEKEQPGTVIEVALSEKALHRLCNSYDKKWVDWYRLKNPPITYRIDGEEIERKEVYDIKEKADSDGWFYVPSSKYDSFHWLPEYFNRYGSIYLNEFFCNGIKIPLVPIAGSGSYVDFMRQRGYFGMRPSIAVIDKKDAFPLDLARKTVLDSFVSEDSVVEELCKFRIAEMLVGRYKSDVDVFSRNGYLPRDRAFLLNTKMPLYLIVHTNITFSFSLGDLDDVAVGFKFAEKEGNLARFSDGMDQAVAGDRLIGDISVTEIWADSFGLIGCNGLVLPAKPYQHVISKTEEWDRDLPLPASVLESDIRLILRYEPTPIQEDENNIMYKMVQRYLPQEINGGWIPLDEEKREAMYRETYHELERYIKPLKEAKSKGLTFR